MVGHRLFEFISITALPQGTTSQEVAIHALPPLAMLLLAVVLWRRVPPLPGPNEPRRVNQKSLAIAAGLLLGTLAAVANLLSMLAKAEGGKATVDPAAAALIVHVALLAPIAEEAAFRGLIYRQLRQWMTPVTGAVASAVLFSMMHGNLHQACWAFALGMTTAIVYEQTRSLLAPILVHALFNAVPVGMAVARRSPDDLGPIWLVICVLALLFTYAARNAERARTS